MKVLILIIAYNAEKTIQGVLDKIPAELGQRHEIKVLILDDSSSDDTFAAGRQYISSGKFNYELEILKNPVNQGYGGNQKLGYHYAIKYGYDVVVLLHGDGQYTPAKLSDMIAPIINGRADAVLGSRMMNKGHARKGGMPLYKYMGNRILTWYENRLLKTSLSEYHSGYRAYSVKALKEIPFDSNTDDFHFDTEIIIQLLKAGNKISEIPIPTYYGDEICYVNGIKYAWNVVRTVALSKAQDWGLWYDRKYDCCPGSDDNRQYHFKAGYTSSHSLCISQIATNSAVLDIGCGAGHIGRYLKKNKSCYVVGIDRIPLEADADLDSAIVFDLNKTDLPVKARDFDYILLLDIIEHLNSPESFMSCLRSTAHSNRDTTIFISVPNVAFWPVRFMLLLGQFNYGRRGILDLRHTRLFTFKSFRHFLRQTGYEVLSIRGIPAPFPLVFGDGILSKALLVINRAAIRMWKGMFSYQLFAVVKPLPTIDNLLENSIKSSAAFSEENSK